MYRMCVRSMKSDRKAYAIQRAMGQNLLLGLLKRSFEALPLRYEYAFHSTFLLPFLGEPAATGVPSAPKVLYRTAKGLLWFGMLIVRSHPELILGSFSIALA